MFTATGDSESANSGCSVEEHAFSAALLTCARCRSPLDPTTRCLDGEYDLVCRECYLLTATEVAPQPLRAQ